jgi:hypothetical protein
MDFMDREKLMAEARKAKELATSELPEPTAESEARGQYLRRIGSPAQQGDLIVGDKALLEQLGITGFGDKSR